MACQMNEGKWGFGESECKMLLAEATLGLKHLLTHLHEQGFVHRDL